jgi:serine/threonine protein kinase
VDTDPLIGRTVHRNLFIKARLGEGAMGTVYLAEHTELPEKKYAIKVLKRHLTHDVSFKQRFFEEATHQAQLDHPNIVQVQDYFNLGDDYFLVLAYVDGHALSETIDAKGGPLDEKQALSIIKDVLNGLDCAHQSAILHRDVKSSNILVDRAGRARLTDFGIARQAGRTRQTEAGRVVGTPEYMSPEQVCDPGRIDHRSDVYSAGIVLFEMLTGKLPFESSSGSAVELQQVNAPTPDPRERNPNIPSGLAKIVTKAMQKDPDERFQGCVEFLKEIEAYERAKDGGRSRYRLAFWGLCLVAALSATVYLLQPPAPPPSPLPPTESTEPAIRALVDAASSNLQMVCREAAQLRIKENAKNLAQQSGNPDLADRFRRQSEEIKANIAQFSSDYAKQLAKLLQFDAATVQRVLAEPSEDSVRARAVTQTGSHYEELLTRDKSPTSDTLLRDCPQPM